MRDYGMPQPRFGNAHRKLRAAARSIFAMTSYRENRTLALEKAEISSIISVAVLENFCTNAVLMMSITFKRRRSAQKMPITAIIIIKFVLNINEKV